MTFQIIYYYLYICGSNDQCETLGWEIETVDSYQPKYSKF